MTKRILFFIQGCGNGHISQAIALNQMILETNNQIVGVYLGVDYGKSTDFLKSEFKHCEVGIYDSPHLIPSAKNKVRINNIKTIINSFLKIPKYIKSLQYINNVINIHSPDIIVNFYEPLFGVYNLFFYKPTDNIINIGHQFMFLHGEYPKSKNFKFHRKMGELFTKYLVGCSGKKIALSYFECSNEKRLTVIPPLLRKKVFNTVSKDDGFILIYLVNNEYRHDIIKQRKLTNRNIHCFCEKFWDGNLDTYHDIDNNIYFHKINGEIFLDYMSRCHVLMCTAGFESISEAAYFGKKIIMIPVKNHFEQELNAIDAQNCQLGKYYKEFDLSAVETLTTPNTEKYKNWVNKSKHLILNNFK